MYFTTRRGPHGRRVVDMVTGRTAPYHDAGSYRDAERQLIEYRNDCIRLMLG